MMTSVKFDSELLPTSLWVLAGFSLVILFLLLAWFVLCKLVLMPNEHVRDFFDLDKQPRSTEATRANKMAKKR